jgi:hypothetical protein
MALEPADESPIVESRASSPESRSPSPGSPAPSPLVPDPKSEVRSPQEDDPPPALGSWRALYAVVIGELALCIALLWLFGRVFA